MIQHVGELEEWPSDEDPWGFESHPSDVLRRRILISEIPPREFKRVLDIGCGQGSVTRELPGTIVIGVDISSGAIKRATRLQDDRLHFIQTSLFELTNNTHGLFDLIVIAGVLYPQYIGHSNALVYEIVDHLLVPDGLLVTAHIDDWCHLRFPYLMLNEHLYSHQEYTHRIEVYVK